MDNSKLYSELLDLVYTNEQISQIITKIDTLASSVYNAKLDLLGLCDEVFPYEIKEAVINIIRKKKLNLKDPSVIEKFLNDLKRCLENIPVVNLTLAFKPNEKSIRHLAEWFASNYTHKIQLQINVDNKLIGGAVVEFNGLYKDYTLKKILEMKRQ